MLEPTKRFLTIWSKHVNGNTEDLRIGLEQLEREIIKHGHWIEPNKEESITVSCFCSECDWASRYYENDVKGMPYCPNCGAKMDE